MPDGDRCGLPNNQKLSHPLVGKGYMMSIIFQLFSAEDLKKLLNTREMEELKNEIRKAADAPGNFLIKNARTRILQPVLKDAQQTQRELQDAPMHAQNAQAEHEAVQKAEQALQNYRQALTTVLRERAYEVFQQLTGQQSRHRLRNERIDLLSPELPDLSQLPDLQEPITQTKLNRLRRQENESWKTFCPQLLHPDDLNRLDEFENEILKLAITCELDNFNFYYALQSVKQSAYAKFFDLAAKNRPKGPDTRYALLNQV